MAISTDIFDGVDLSRLPAPQVVETLDFDAIKTALIADILLVMPEFSALSPADPAIKLLELFAYRELLLRTQINEAALAVMAAFATGADLDHLAADHGVERFILVEADASRRIAEVLETDEDFRARYVRAPEGWSVAGPIGAYVDLATRASSNVRFASCISPAPMEVLVTVQARDGDGSASLALLTEVLSYLSDVNRRPLGDRLTVQSARITVSDVVADIRTFSGPDPALVLNEVRARFAVFKADNERLGRDVTADGLHACLRAEGVSKVTLVGWADVICDETQAWFCPALTLNHVGVGQ
jgi:phage-related baseplate assembly protein